MFENPFLCVIISNMEKEIKNFKKVSFITSIARAADLKDFNLDEIAVVGRSNVGKSSFINMLAERTIARTSKDPGRTRLLNFFDFDGRFVLVDLPGYGYAKAGKDEQMKWKELIEKYLLGSKRLKNVLLLVDARHTPTEKDLQMMNFLFFHNLPFTVVATKSDKIPKSKIPVYIREIAKSMKIGVENIFVVSNLSSQGKEAVIKRIFQFTGEN